MKKKILCGVLAAAMTLALSVTALENTVVMAAEENEAAEIFSTGPNGETATPATELSLTDEEIETIKEGNYTAAISFHYGGNDWSSAQQKEGYF